MWWASIVPILVFLGLSVVKLGRGTRQTDRLSFHNAPGDWRNTNLESVACGIVQGRMDICIMIGLLETSIHSMVWGSEAVRWLGRVERVHCMQSVLTHSASKSCYRCTHFAYWTGVNLSPVSIQTQALAFLAVFVYATHATQAIAFEWKPGFRLYWMYTDYSPPSMF